MMMSSKNGFTLLELLVVIGIMVLLMSAAVAGYIGIRRGAELRGGVMTLRTTMMLARQDAVTKRRSVIVEFKKSASLTVPDTMNIISLSAGVMATNKIIHLPLGVQFDGAADPAAITFKPSGKASGIGSQSITLIERAGAVAGATTATRASRTVKVWFLTGITKEE
jgi:prepilin-type N-terminal cleavage/methylation domain-containing protein